MDQRRFIANQSSLPNIARILGIGVYSGTQKATKVINILVISLALKNGCTRHLKMVVQWYFAQLNFSFTE